MAGPPILIKNLIFGFGRSHGVARDLSFGVCACVCVCGCVSDIEWVRQIISNHICEVDTAAALVVMRLCCFKVAYPSTSAVVVPVSQSTMAFIVVCTSFWRDSCRNGST
ncbi:hypothetical protein L1987_51461 [Smallanthus sonchifolius]|uniref:Uncharacterized protein n=1 Tax=Smallanthus sonchifolius TaxID=185202 RepID=A0ACB9EQH7_9ASTR|nr:hypothetical protein L1987_51461 [Smallanthus sonchifolius]